MMVHALFETTLVNYVVSGSLPSTTLFLFLKKKGVTVTSNNSPPL